GFTAPGQPVQVTTLRAAACIDLDKARLDRHPPAPAAAALAVTGRREVWLAEAGGIVACPLFERDRLGPGHDIEGPAIIEQMDCTTLVLPGQHARVDPFLNLLIEG
ncbi:MAG: hydantoinase/oxoprolinase family protein, partial [Acetobacteraceae bacterium]|nr:hydantoinase/oxoprolinase family protein [Acetobacteraceae bacterium]